MASSNKMNTNFTCEICEETFTANHSKNQHIKIVHGEVKTFECNVCNRVFGQKYGLRKHVENQKVRISDEAHQHN